VVGGTILAAAGRGEVPTLDDYSSPPDFAMDSGESPVRGLEAALRAAEDRFEKVFEASPVAIAISTLEDGRIVDANPMFARWSGYTRAELVGRTSTELGLWRQPLDRERVAEQLRQGGLLQNLDIEYRAKDGRTGVALCSLVRAVFGGEDCILALCTDITGRRRAELRLRLLQEVSRSIAEAEDLTSALTRTVRQICEATDWRYGEAWVPAGSGDRLILRGGWHLDNRPLSALHRVARHMSPRSGEGLAGQVWQSGTAIWVPDLGTVTHPHAEEAMAAGLRAAVGIPALAGRDVAAALVFYMDQPRERDPEMIELVTAVAVQLGTLIRSRRAERALHLASGEITPTEEAGSEGAPAVPPSVFRASPAPLLLSTLEEGQILEVSRGFERVFAHQRDDVVGRKESELGLWVHGADRAEVVGRVREGTANGGLQVRLRSRHGHILEVVLAAEVLTVEGRECLVASLLDVTAQRRFEQQLQRQALMDPLTELPNRILFEDRIRQALVRARREARRIAVVALDLDRFQGINDSLGHASGDRLLVAVSRRLRNCLREHDTVARLGGDQFGVLLEELEDLTAARAAAARITQVFEAPFSVHRTDVHIGASVGLALSSPRLSEPEDLLRSADAAMHRAKTDRGISVRFYEPDVDRSARERFQLEQELRGAIAAEQLFFQYQPIISLHTGTIEAAEALIRWQHPQRGMLLPHEFFPVAEESGLVFPIGEWVVRESVRRLEEWREAHLVHPAFRMAFNLSPRQFHRPGLLDLFAGLLQESEVPPRCLQLEITETLALSDPETIAELRRLDLHVVIDDVGTGYSSLENLARMEVDGLKIDRTFIAGLVDAPREDAIVEALILLARRLGVPVVAEGVETIAQLNRLRELGCGLAQGFFFAKPLDLPVFEALLGRSPHW